MSWKPVCNITSEDAQFAYCAQPASAIAFSVLFGITLLAHVLQSFTFRKKFCWVVVMAAAWEFVGLATRVSATRDQTKSSTGPASNILVLLAPLWVNAFVYMVFGRMVYYFLPEQKIGGIKAVHMARWFVWLDVSAFIVQATGGVLTQDENPNQVKMGLRLYTIGIGVQEAFIVIFMALAIRFHWKMINGHGIPERGDGWKRLMYTIYGTLTLITVRIIFRLSEFASLNPNSHASTTEAYFYAFDAFPMCFALVLWNIIHPGSILQGPESLFPKKPKMSRKEKKAAKREKKENKDALKMQERSERKHRKHRRHSHGRRSDGEHFMEPSYNRDPRDMV